MYHAAIEALHNDEPDLAILLIRQAMARQPKEEPIHEDDVPEIEERTTDFISQAFQGWEAA